MNTTPTTHPFPTLVGKFFTETILPNLEIHNQEEKLEATNQYIADASCNPELITTIENHYQIKIW